MEGGGVVAPPPPAPVEAPAPAPDELSETAEPPPAPESIPEPPPAAPAPVNLNIDVRVLSPGDNGDVTQEIEMPAEVRAPVERGSPAPGDDAGGGLTLNWVWNWEWTEAPEMPDLSGDMPEFPFDSLEAPMSVEPPAMSAPAPRLPPRSRPWATSTRRGRSTPGRRRRIPLRGRLPWRPWRSTRLLRPSRRIPRTTTPPRTPRALRPSRTPTRNRHRPQRPRPSRWRPPPRAAAAARRFRWRSRCSDWCACSHRACSSRPSTGRESFPPCSAQEGSNGRANARRLTYTFVPGPRPGRSTE